MKKIVIISAVLALVCGSAAAQTLDDMAKQQQAAVEDATQAYKDQAQKSARQIDRLPRRRDIGGVGVRGEKGRERKAQWEVTSDE